jgi:hypothetical protein
MSEVPDSIQVRVKKEKSANKLHATSAMTRRSQDSLGASPKWVFKAAW